MLRSSFKRHPKNLPQFHDTRVFLVGGASVVFAVQVAVSVAGSAAKRVGQTGHAE